jgi:hypothetical protein
MKELFSTVQVPKRDPKEFFSLSLAKAAPQRQDVFVELYRSEVIEDSPTTICPSLVAVFQREGGIDYQIRVRLHFTSKSWTASKELLIGEIVVSLAQVTAIGHLKAVMRSPYMIGTVNLTCIPAFRPILEHPGFQPRGLSNPRNPLVTPYVFHRDDDYTAPKIYVEEMCLETRISLNVSASFLETVLAGLQRSKGAWINLRHQVANRNRGVISSADITVDISADGCPTDACREWEWLLGYDGSDPLADPLLLPLPPVAAASSSSSAATVALARVATPVATVTAVTALSREVDLLDLGDDYFQSNPFSTCTTVGTVSTTGSVSGSGNGTGGGSGSGSEVIRSHCRYSVGFLDQYVSRMDELISEVTGALSSVRSLAAAGNVFRSSTSKKNMAVQAVAVNLHMQVMAVRDVASGGHAETVLDTTTCGCFSPHGLGFQEKQGLDTMESSLAVSLQKLDDHKRRLMDVLRGAPAAATASAPSAGSSGAPSLLDMDWPDSAAAAARSAPAPSGPLSGQTSLLASDISSRAMDYDSRMLTTGRRKVFALSQALSVAVSSVLMKLTLVAEGRIPFDVAEGWLLRGFLLTFEGLLSVIGNERFMLEDSVAAIDALNQYRVRVLLSRTAAGSPADVTMRGREVQLHLSSDAMRALPPAYSCDGGAVLPLVGVLFNQGIDLHQSLALAASSLSAIATQAQANVARSPSRETLAGSERTGAVTSPLRNGDDAHTAGGSLDDTASKQSLQHAINVRALVRLLNYCQQLDDEDAASAAAAVAYSAAAAAMESIDSYRLLSHLQPSPRQATKSSSSHGSHVRSGSGGQSNSGKSSALNKAVNASKVAMSITSVAGSALRSTLTSYGARLLKQEGPADGAAYAVTGPEGASAAPLSDVLNELSETVLSNSNVISKNVDLLVAVERVCALLGGCRVTFCKSGKDRTGMAVTYEQSRVLGERFNCGTGLKRAIRDANVMRMHGVRLSVCEKNIGRRNYSINALQVQFMPVMYRPPNEVLEIMMRTDAT